MDMHYVKAWKNMSKQVIAPFLDNNEVVAFNRIIVVLRNVCYTKSYYWYIEITTSIICMDPFQEKKHRML